MGVKGRRKRERQRAEREQAEAMRLQGEEGFDEEDDDMMMDDDDDGGADMPPPGLGMGGPFSPPSGNRHSSHTNRSTMHDMDYLEKVREDHENRKNPKYQEEQRMMKRRRVEGKKRQGADVFEGDDEYDEDDDVLPPEASRVLEWDDDIVLSVDQGDRRSKKGNNKLTSSSKSLGVGASFAHPLLGIHEPIAEALAAQGFNNMSVIQQRTLPIALQGKDLLGQAKTGSGKTLAYLVPLLQATYQRVKHSPTTFVALVVSPTKELCVQIHNVLSGIAEKLRPNADFKVELITGGTKIQEERRRLLACNVAIGTPGRVTDHLRNTRGWSLSTLQVFILDEADRMLADGFQRDLDALVEALPETRQTLLFSATNQKAVREVARLSLADDAVYVATKGNEPSYIKKQHLQDGTEVQPAPYMDFGSHEEEDGDGDNSDGENEKSTLQDAESIPSSLKQFAQLVPLRDRLRALYAFVKRIVKGKSKALVFSSTVASTQFHCMMMGAVGFHDEVLMLHGKMKHRQRVQTFDYFRKWDSGVLFCTDVASRGLDIAKVDWILQLDPPTDPTEYVHRIGRTARAGNAGNSLMFVAPEEQGVVKYFNEAFKSVGARILAMPPKSIGELPDIQMQLEHVLEIDPIVGKAAVEAFRAFIAAYGSYILKDIFNVHMIDLDGLAMGFALKDTPAVSLPKPAEVKSDYVKGKLKSLNKRRKAAKLWYETEKTKKQWTDSGEFVGVSKPSTKFSA